MDLMRSTSGTATAAVALVALVALVVGCGAAPAASALPASPWPRQSGHGVECDSGGIVERRRIGVW